ncbi:ABC transporter permease [Alloyangia pacifica]|uniref:Spermidine/putrescine transport system permease protein n=1 Tax=Alloyangia pacifica TaxID=311180 RepID=A0A1I6RSZ3_9RHOB|nr:ABC transporter permease [Alloyangia pacifica]SDG59353.1 spermidine/putrescine transport system permease protein [Alloyangia pacifica]SFS67847.1 spermidine/putrescine transport system permease protein [Alloyangia pacifica]
MRSARVWGLMPAWVLMLGTLMVPLLIVAAVSVAERGSYGGFAWDFNPLSYREILFSEDWDGNLVFDPKYLSIIGRTLLLAGATTLICMALALPVAYVIATRPPKTKALLIYLVTLPFWVSMIVRVYAWLIILGNEGFVGRFWHWIGGEGTLLFTPGAMLVGMVYSYIPLMVLPVFAAIEKLDPALLEAGADLYGSRWTTARRVILPLTWPGLAAGAVLVFVPALGTVLEPMLLGGGKQMMMGTLIQTQFGGARNWPFGAAVALVLMAMVVIVLVINARRSMSREVRV